MKILLFILIILAFIKTVSYGFYEFKEHKNKPGAIAIFCLALGSSVLTSIVTFLK